MVNENIEEVEITEEINTIRLDYAYIAFYEGNLINIL